MLKEDYETMLVEAYQILRSPDKSSADKLSKVLSNHPKIWYLQVNGFYLDQDEKDNTCNIQAIATLSQALKYNTTLKHLNLFYVKLCDTSIASITKTLQHAGHLQILSLFGVKLSDPLMSILAESLEHNTTLLGIAFTNCGIKKITTLIPALQNNKTLSLLDLCGNELDGASVRALLQIMKLNTKIRRLNLSNYLIHAGHDRSLRFPTYIREICLDENFLTEDSIKSLSQILSTVNSLTLRHTQLNDTSIKPLFLELTRNTSLQLLNIMNNDSLGNASIILLGQALRHNTTLNYLWLDLPNYADIATSIEFLQIMLQHTKLRYLSIGKGRDLFKTSLETVILTLEHNSSLNHLGFFDADCASDMHMNEETKTSTYSRIKSLTARNRGHTPLRYASILLQKLKLENDDTNNDTQQTATNDQPDSSIARLPYELLRIIFSLSLPHYAPQYIDQINSSIIGLLESRKTTRPTAIIAPSITFFTPPRTNPHGLTQNNQPSENLETTHSDLKL